MTLTSTVTSLYPTTIQHLPFQAITSLFQKHQPCTSKPQAATKITTTEPSLASTTSSLQQLPPHTTHCHVSRQPCLSLSPPNHLLLVFITFRQRRNLPRIQARCRRHRFQNLRNEAAPMCAASCLGIPIFDGRDYQDWYLKMDVILRF